MRCHNQFLKNDLPVFCLGAVWGELRDRRLLMHKKEILKLGPRATQDGLALVPLSVYFKDSRVKVELGLCRGKKLYDKRDTDAKRQAGRDMERALKNR